MDRSDHRHRQLAPLQRRLLDEIGIAVGTLRQLRAFPAGQLFHDREVEPGAETLALPRQHDAAQAGQVEQRPAGIDQRFEHRPVDGIALVGARQPQQRDAAAVDVERDPVVRLEFLFHPRILARRLGDSITDRSEWGVSSGVG